MGFLKFCLHGCCSTRYNLDLPTRKSDAPLKFKQVFETKAIVGGLYIAPITNDFSFLSPSRRREAPCEGTNSPRLFTPGETKALAKSKVHQLSRAWVTNDAGVLGGWSSSLI
jgi:hypothetical protein